MSLVRAAKEDFATMVLQERRMLMFTNNLQASDGHGPSQADREAKFRAQQEREAEEFVNIHMRLYLKQYSPKILSTICQKLLKITGQNENKKMMQARKAKKN